MKPETLTALEKAIAYAESKHGAMTDSPLEFSNILMEEAGEVAHAVNDFYWHGGNIEPVKHELLQTAAVCIRILEVL